MWLPKRLVSCSVLVLTSSRGSFDTHLFVHFDHGLSGFGLKLFHSFSPCLPRISIAAIIVLANARASISWIFDFPGGFDFGFVEHIGCHVRLLRKRTVGFTNPILSAPKSKLARFKDKLTDLSLKREASPQLQTSWQRSLLERLASFSFSWGIPTVIRIQVARPKAVKRSNGYAFLEQSVIGACLLSLRFLIQSR